MSRAAQIRRGLKSHRSENDFYEAVRRLEEAIALREYYAACCPNCEVIYRPIVDSLEEALHVAVYLKV